MDPYQRAQDVLQCQLCDNCIPAMYCEDCHKYLCKACLSQHIYDEPKQHKVLPFDRRDSTLSYPKCPKHSIKECGFFCRHCDIPVCDQCISIHHNVHDVVDIFEHFKSKKEVLRTDLQELEKSSCPDYQKMLSDIPAEKAELHANFQKLGKAFDKQGEKLHREIDIIVEKLKCNLDQMETKQLAKLTMHEEEIQRLISKVTQTISYVKDLLNCNDICLVSLYKSNNEELKSIPSKPKVLLPHFMPEQINHEQLSKQFGVLSAPFMETEENTVDYLMPVTFPAERLPNNEALIITSVSTDYGVPNGLHSVSSFNDEEFWTCGQDSIMRLYNLQGKLLNSIKTTSKNDPCDIALTAFGDLVYTDGSDCTVNTVTDTRIQGITICQGWRPSNICRTSSGDLLVIMNRIDNERTKLVRLSGSKEIQCIQYNDKGQSLYSSGCYNTRYITGNRNFDICVADWKAGAVVVVDRFGKHRFTYTGPTSSVSEEPMDPRGIATDSLCQILAADCGNHLIHILDQDGQFLRYIDSCDLDYPWGLCVDSKDNLFVAEWGTGKVKIIQYYP